MRDETPILNSPLEEISKNPSKNPYVITSAYRTLQVLQAFAAPPHRFGLAELMGRMGLEKNQLYRSLKTLEHAGFLIMEGDGRFTFTSLLNHLSSATVKRQEQSLVDVAQPYLDDLVGKTGESVNLFVRAGDFAVCVDRRDSPQLVRLASVLGLSVPLHAGAVPKAMLAFLSEEAQERVLSQIHQLPSYTRLSAPCSRILLI
jgi:IclR family acetate operon transcriptional repressor